MRLIYINKNSTFHFWKYFLEKRSEKSDIRNMLREVQKTNNEKADVTDLLISSLMIPEVGCPVEQKQTF